MMRNVRVYMLLIAALFVGVACEETKPDVEQPQDKGGFKIEIFDLHSSHCKVKVTPEDLTSQYFCGVATETYLSTFGPLDDMTVTATNFIETVILENSDVAISDLMKKGVYEREVTGLQPEQKFIVFACHTDETGAIGSEIVTVSEVTPPVEASQNSFEIEIDQITATSAMLFITPTTDDEYVWLEFPEFVYKDMTMEELEAFLLKNYKPFFPLHSNTGEMVHSFDDALEPDTEYMIIVFGYDGGLTTPLTTKKFHTLAPGDPTDVTFTFEYGAMTARSTYVTFTPSDVSVTYLALVADEEEFSRYGEVNAEVVKKLVDQQIKKAMLTGDCEDRADFARIYGRRGEQTGSFALKPGLKHYACAVCLDAEGNFASEVAIDEFTAPSEEETDASVTASVLKYFDGSELAELDSYLYGDYFGWAAVRIKFTIGGSAVNALYTIYPTDMLEQENATDDEIRAMLLDDSLYDVYNFTAEPLTEVLLEWGYDYTLFAIPFDVGKNAGELFRLDIPALDKNGASPVSEY